MDAHPKPPDQDPPSSQLAWIVGPAFLLLAAWFLWFAPPASVPAAGTPEFNSAGLAPTVRPTLKQDPPITRVGAFEYKCMDCHRVFQNQAEKTQGLVQHTGIFFNHGMNNRCFNCHDRIERDKLVARDGSYLSYTQIPELCSQCHGTTYRDWQRGMHGKTMGSWETGDAGQVRLTCSQCHDPHAPAFPQYTPLPAPNTLRMGDPSAAQHHESESPLALPFEHGGSGVDHDAPAHEPAEHAPEGGAEH